MYNSLRGWRLFATAASWNSFPTRVLYREKSDRTLSIRRISRRADYLSEALSHHACYNFKHQQATSSNDHSTYFSGDYLNDVLTLVKALQDLSFAGAPRTISSTAQDRHDSVIARYGLHPAEVQGTLMSLNTLPNETNHRKIIQLTSFEQQYARLLTTLQRLVSLAAHRVHRKVFLMNQAALAAFLLHGSKFLPFNPSLKGSYPLCTSLDMHGGKVYLQLLSSHAAKPQCAKEWEHLTRIFCASPIMEVKDGGSVAIIPLLPSSLVASAPTKAESPFSSASSLLGSLTALLSASEAAMMIQWSKLFFPDRHISSDDIEMSIRKVVLESGQRTCGDGERQDQILLDYLVRLWNESSAREAKCPMLRRFLGIAHTHFSALQIEGSCVFLTMKNESTKEGVLGSTKGFHELLTMGKWQTVLREVLQRLRACADADTSEKVSDLTLLSQDSFDVDSVSCNAVFFEALQQDMIQFFNLLVLKRLPMITQKILTHRWQLKSPPKSLFQSPPTEEELRLLRNPSIRGLVLLDARPTATEGQEHESVLSQVHQLRQRLWILAHIPSHMSRTLVRFESQKNVGSTLPLLDRSLARELIGYLLVSGYGLAFSVALEALNRESFTRKGDKAPWKSGLNAIRRAVQPLLFGQPHPCYSGLNEHVLTLFIRLASTSSASLYSSAVTKEQMILTKERVTSKLLAQIAQEVLVESLHIFFAPPAPSHYSSLMSSVDDLSNPTQSKNGTLSTRKHTLRTPIEYRVENFLSQPHDSILIPDFMQIEPMASVGKNEPYFSMHANALPFLRKRVSCLRNFHFSLYIEGLAAIAPIHELVAALEREVKELGPPVLAPESAAALLTAIVLHLTSATASPHSVDSEAFWLKRLTEIGCGAIFFTVPHDKFHSISSYFKGTYSSSYVRAVVASEAGEGIDPSSGSFDVESGWGGAEALLNGRSLRVTDPYPSTTTDRFFKLRMVYSDEKSKYGFSKKLTSIAVDHTLPPLRIQLCAMDLRAASTFFLAKQRSDALQYTNKKDELLAGPHVVAAGLPGGLAALYKPPGVNCTLHAHHPSLLSFLSQKSFWKAQSVGCGSSTATEDPSLYTHLSIPVLHQHGLVNRIDLGTSGLVMAASTLPSLLSSIFTTSVQRRVEKAYQVLLRGSTGPGIDRLMFLPPSGIISGSVFGGGADASYMRRPAGDWIRSSTTKWGASTARLPVAMLDRRQALTTFRVLEYFPKGNIYFVEVRLRSGRRHQIRQHFARLGFPLLGDERYGDTMTHHHKKYFLDRPALHAFRIDITASGKVSSGESEAGEADEHVVVECPLPADFSSILEHLREENTAKRK